MARAWIPSFVALAVAAAGMQACVRGEYPKVVVPDVPDLTIKTLETSDSPQSTVQTNILYFKGAWRRTQLYLTFPSAFPDQRTVRYTTITRCDERRTLELNHEAQLYGWSPLNFVGRDVYWMRPGWRQRRERSAVGADVKIIIETVDTGERRQVGSYYSARHVITTTTTDPSPGANTRRSDSVEDGWYIDVPPSDCGDAGDRHVLLTGSVVHPGEVPDRTNVEFRGAGRRGFPINATTRRRGEREPAITTRVKLIEFSDAVLDRSLFDAPAGYRPALPRLIGRFDMTTPDTTVNRLAAYWQDVMTLARDFFRF
jgi:hypothetical protein